jgi:hypothetical protein
VPVTWKESDESDLCPAARVPANPNLNQPAVVAPPPEFLSDVESITVAHPPNGTEKEAEYYARLVPYFEARGLYIALYGEELAVARRSGVSENYDRMLTNRQLRTGVGTFMSRCFPATRSAPLVAPEAPGGGIVPVYPARVTRVNVKIHTPAAKRADGLTLMDGVAWSSGPNPDFPGRPNWPACGPEGETDAEKEARVRCDRSLAPIWRSSKGGHAHITNKWLYHAKKGSEVQACVGNVCSLKVKAQ